MIRNFARCFVQSTLLPLKTTYPVNLLPKIETQPDSLIWSLITFLVERCFNKDLQTIFAHLGDLFLDSRRVHSRRL